MLMNTMKLVEFPEHTIVIATKQSAYNPMPAWRSQEATGMIVCCWRLTVLERLKLLFTGRLWHQMYTFGQPVQPQRLTVDKPAMPKPMEPAWN